jgi:hypothetical protein
MNKTKLLELHKELEKSQFVTIVASTKPSKVVGVSWS